MSNIYRVWTDGLVLMPQDSLLFGATQLDESRPQETAEAAPESSQGVGSAAVAATDSMLVQPLADKQTSTGSIAARATSAASVSVGSPAAVGGHGFVTHFMAWRQVRRGYRDFRRRQREFE